MVLVPGLLAGGFYPAVGHEGATLLPPPSGECVPGVAAEDELKDPEGGQSGHPDEPSCSSGLQEQLFQPAEAVQKSHVLSLGV